MATFEARWAGICVDCGGDFRAGDEIRYDGTGQLIHAGDCEPDLEIPAQVCPLCFVALPVSQECDCRD